jgi:hypothetical protein
MFADPITTKVGADSVTLPRVTAGKDSAVYRDPNFRATPDGETGLEVFVSHMYGKRTRRTFRVNAVKNMGGQATFLSSPTVSMSTYLVLDTPASGFAKAEILNIVGSLLELISDDALGQMTPSDLADRWIDGES